MNHIKIPLVYTRESELTSRSGTFIVHQPLQQKETATVLFMVPDRFHDTPQNGLYQRRFTHVSIPGCHVPITVSFVAPHSVQIIQVIPSFEGICYSSTMAASLLSQTPKQVAGQPHLLETNKFLSLTCVTLGDRSAAIPGPQSSPTQLQREDAADGFVQACVPQSSAAVLGAATLPSSASWGRADSFFARVVHNESLLEHVHDHSYLAANGN